MKTTDMVYTVNGSKGIYRGTLQSFNGELDEAIAKFREEFKDYVITHVNGYNEAMDDNIPF